MIFDFGKAAWGLFYVGVGVGLLVAACGLGVGAWLGR